MKSVKTIIKSPPKVDEIANYFSPEHYPVSILTSLNFKPVRLNNLKYSGKVGLIPKYTLKQVKIHTGVVPEHIRGLCCE